MSIKEAQDNLNHAAAELICTARPTAYLPKARPHEKFVLVDATAFERLCKAEKAFDAIDLRFTAAI